MLPEKYLFIIVSQRNVEYLMLAVTVIILRKNQGCPKTNSIHGI